MHVVVTGASSGVGIALAREFGRSEGDRVTLVARRRAAMEEVARSVSAKCHIVAHDLSDDARATAWIESAERENGPIDVLINNAGVENTGWTLEADPAASVALLRTNLVSPLLNRARGRPADDRTRQRDSRQRRVRRRVLGGATPSVVRRVEGRARDVQ
jgi:NADP-dependent 3-hydroxy acid dehydrogenase YdfG